MQPLRFSIGPELTCCPLRLVAYIAERYGVGYVQAMAMGTSDVGQLTHLGFRPRHTLTDLWCHSGEAVGSERFAAQGDDTDQNL